MPLQSSLGLTIIQKFFHQKKTTQIPISNPNLKPERKFFKEPVKIKESNSVHTRQNPFGTTSQTQITTASKNQNFIAYTVFTVKPNSKKMQIQETQFRERERGTAKACEEEEEAVASR